MHEKRAHSLTRTLGWMAACARVRSLAYIRSNAPIWEPEEKQSDNEQKESFLTAGPIWLLFVFIHPILTHTLASARALSVIHTGTSVERAHTHKIFKLCALFICVPISTNGKLWITHTFSLSLAFSVSFVLHSDALFHLRSCYYDVLNWHRRLHNTLPCTIHISMPGNVCRECI